MKSRKVKLKFDVDAGLLPGIMRLCDVLGFEIGDGITVTAKQCDRTGVSLKWKAAHISYARKNLFFRELGILVECAKKGKDIEAYEDGHFENISVMVDASRGAVPTVDGMKKLTDYLAVMGYSMVMLYTEDVVALPDYQYFGYMRGRYTCEELRAIDDYAYVYGIEAIPCLECYGHMEKYLLWDEAEEIKDTPNVLLAREEKTFKFVEQLISTVSSCFRSKRIHIGMDEAWNMGRGNFLTKHGHIPPFEIFNEYMERLIQITGKYGLRPMMWSDMYFRVNTTDDRYYGEDIEVAREVIEKVPEGVELVFWHYGEEPHCDDYMLEKHKVFNRKIIYAGGTWGWMGHFPENSYALETCRESLAVCRKHGVREAMNTVWTNDGAECDLFANLLPLSFFAELCFDTGAGEEKLRARFEATTGGSYDAFFAMGNYHNSFENGEKYENYNDRFLGKALFWQDIMEGLYDAHLFDKPMSVHYRKSAENMKKYSGGRWDCLYKLAYAVFDYLAVKTYIAENLAPAYLRGDRVILERISRKALPKLRKKILCVHKMHRKLWHDKLKSFGWSTLDIRYGGVAARCETAKGIIEDYLAGKIPAIEQLEEKRLPKKLSGFGHYNVMIVHNFKIR